MKSSSTLKMLLKNTLMRAATRRMRQRVSPLSLRAWWTTAMNGGPKAMVSRRESASRLMSISIVVGTRVSSMLTQNYLPANTRTWQQKSWSGWKNRVTNPVKRCHLIQCFQWKHNIYVTKARCTRQTTLHHPEINGDQTCQAMNRNMRIIKRGCTS